MKSLKTQAGRFLCPEPMLTWLLSLRKSGEKRNEQEKRLKRLPHSTTTSPYLVF
jgi:hypothetical protein